MHIYSCELLYSSEIMHCARRERAREFGILVRDLGKASKNPRLAKLESASLSLYDRLHRGLTAARRRGVTCSRVVVR